MRFARIFIRTLICAFALYILFVVFGLANYFIYYPMRYPMGEWQRQALAGAEERWVTSADGTRLNCAWYPNEQAKFATLFLHGNAGNVTHRVDHAHALRAAGSAVLVVDYRGYGKSEGRPSEAGLYADAEAGYRELIRLGYTRERIIVHGESLGTAVAADLAARLPSAALVLESPLMSISKMAGRVLPFLGPLLARGFDTYSKISRVHVPVLILQGEADEIVPFAHGQAIFERANNPKRLWRIPEGRHNELLLIAAGEYSNRLREFYDSLP